MSYVIKRLSAGDADVLGDIAPDVFDEPINRIRLAAYLSTPGHLMLLAVDGELVVGQCAAVIHRNPDKPTELYVDEVGTASTHRRQGIARKMLSAMLDWGRELGCEAGQGFLFAPALPAAEVTPLIVAAVPPFAATLL